ncbi:MAG TPA: thioredoxin family protein [Candidatus Krumholzibacteria bacterium]|nr:thioredoxin family protein [Candidatus Krumholzibacteria bacterium]
MATKIAATKPKVVSHDKWLTARRAFLKKEKEFTRLRDRLSEARRALPWEKVTKQYVFDTAGGRRTLADLFEGRSQLVVYHAMFNPKAAGPKTSWTKDAACMGCSFWADNFNGVIAHLNARDVTMLAVSRASVAKIAAFQKRMGWTFQWVSSGDGPFNFDYGVSFTEAEVRKKKAFYNFSVQDPLMSEREGVSVFYRDGAGSIFHTYSAYARGIDLLNTAYNYLDIVPRGRDEDKDGQSWVRLHDEYDAAACADCDCEK